MDACGCRYALKKRAQTKVLNRMTMLVAEQKDGLSKQTKALLAISRCVLRWKARRSSAAAAALANRPKTTTIAKDEMHEHEVHDGAGAGSTPAEMSKVGERVHALEVKVDAVLAKLEALANSRVRHACAGHDVTRKRS